MTDLDTRLSLLTDAAQFDVCNRFSEGGRRYKPRRAALPGVAAEDASGRARPVLRLLMSSACAWNCSYCPLRTANDIPRAALTPEDLPQIFLPRYNAGAVQGLFLATAVDGDVDQALNRMLDGVELLRATHGYRGYIHIKILPGAAAASVERAARLADRLSLNLEAPGPQYLARISAERDWTRDLIERLRWARDWQRAGDQLPAGLATQFVVGAAGEPDRDLLTTSSWLYSDFGLRRAYFSPFRPVAGTPLAATAATPALRVQRLQQADWLLRQYGFVVAELPFAAGGDLPLQADPKLAWALANPALFPVEINSAPPEMLLRVPGLGPVAVRRIVRLRRSYSFRELEHLTSLGPQAARARDFVTIDGRFYGRDLNVVQAEVARRKPLIVEQLSLW